MIPHFCCDFGAGLEDRQFKIEDQDEDMIEDENRGSIEDDDQDQD